MKVQITEKELKQLIRETIEEMNYDMLTEGEWLDTAKELGRAGLNFGKATGKKIAQGAEWLGNKIGDGIDTLQGGDKGRAESNLMFIVKDKPQPDIHLIRDYDNSIEKLKKMYPAAWKIACERAGYDPSEEENK